MYINLTYIFLNVDHIFRRILPACFVIHLAWYVDTEQSLSSACFE